MDAHDNPTTVRIHIRRAKTDPFGKGAFIFLGKTGAATSAAARGVPDHLIKMLGRWQSEAYQLYVRSPPESLAAVSAQLVQSAQ